MQQTWVVVNHMQASRHSSAMMLHMLAMHLRELASFRHRLETANMPRTAYTQKELLHRFSLLQSTSKLPRQSSSCSPGTLSPAAR
jgi:hypothetical protein